MASSQPTGDLPSQRDDVSAYRDLHGGDKQVQKQFRNRCGGYVWIIEPLDRLERYLILGPVGDDVNTIEHECMKSLDWLIEDGQGLDAVQKIQEIYKGNRHISRHENCRHPAINALVRCLRCNDPNTREAAYQLIPEVCVIPTHLFTLIDYHQDDCQNFYRVSVNFATEKGQTLEQDYVQQESECLLRNIEGTSAAVTEPTDENKGTYRRTFQLQGVISKGEIERDIYNFIGKSDEYLVKWIRDDATVYLNADQKTCEDLYFRLKGKGRVVKDTDMTRKNWNWGTIDVSFLDVVDENDLKEKVLTFLKLSAEEGSKRIKISGKGRGWSRRFKRAIAEWYTKKDPRELLQLVTQYRRRCNMTHAKVLKRAHPIGKRKKGDEVSTERTHPESDLSPDMQMIFRYLFKGRKYDQNKKIKLPMPSNEIDKLLAMYMRARYFPVSPGCDLRDLYKLVRENRLSWEHIPHRVWEYWVSPRPSTEDVNAVKNKNLWAALLPGLGAQGLLRSLCKMARHGVFQDRANVATVVEKLGELNTGEDPRMRVHPFYIQQALTVYREGCTPNNDQGHDVCQEIKDALEKAVYDSFSGRTGLKKRICVAVDLGHELYHEKRGSMEYFDIAAFVMLTVARMASKPVLLLSTHTDCYELVPELAKKGKAVSDATWKDITDLLRELPGQTAKTQPANPTSIFKWAYEQKHHDSSPVIDVFVIFTDSLIASESSAHPFKALKMYADKWGRKDILVVTCAMKATANTISDPSNNNMVDLVGLDSSLPEMIFELCNK